MRNIPGALAAAVKPNPHAKSPQASDDFASASEDSSIYINVLTNDLGGPARTLYSVDQANPLVVQTVAQSKLGATIAIINGQISYDPTGASGLQALAQGETAADSFTYSLRLGNGMISVATVYVTVTGQNDPASINGTATGSVTEDGTLIAGGTLTVTDPDHDQNHFQIVSASALHGAYGDFTFDANTGVWGYTLHNSAANVQALSSNDVVYDHLTVTSADSTANQTIDVTIHGANEGAGGNQFLDVFAANPLGPNQLMINDGAGNFAVTNLPGTGYHVDVALGDFNRDGSLDAVVLNNSNGTGDPVTIQFLTNDGTGHFTLTEMPAASSNSSHLAVGDVNGDGWLDVVTASGDFNVPNQLLVNDGTGQFTAHALPGASHLAWDVALGDINGDGALDIVVARALLSSQLLTNNGDGTFTVTDLPSLGSGVVTQSIALGDVNGDHRLDIVFANENGPNKLLINEGDTDSDGAVNFTASDLPSDVLPPEITGRDYHQSICVALGDVNGDGFLDAFFGSTQGDPNQLLTNNGDGTFTARNLPAAFDYNSGVFAVALADINNDGSLDAILGYNGPEQVMINDGQGNLSANTAISTDSNFTFGIAVGDLNGDGPVPAVDLLGQPNINPAGLLPSMYVT